MFNEDYIKRYSRHILLPEIGGSGQTKLSQAKVFVVGTGGLGSPAAFYLAAAGVGTLGLIDDDVVDLSNLQRQILHATPDLNRPKVESAKAKLTALNPECNVITHHYRLTAENVLDLIADYDIVVDGTDNFPTRYLINDACVIAKKPLVHGGILRFNGQVMTIKPGEGPCFRCIFREPPPAGAVPTCAEAGVLGAVAGIIGVIQATEVIKLVLGKGDPLVGRILTLDALKLKFRDVKISRNPACPVCGENPTITQPVEYELPPCELRAN